MIRMDTVPQSLRAFFKAHSRLALAFSGGVDSAYLLYAARACGCDVAPFYARSAFQPEFERRDALRLAGQLGVTVTVDPGPVGGRTYQVEALAAVTADFPGAEATVRFTGTPWRCSFHSIR